MDTLAGPLEGLGPLLGAWRGVNRLWFMPGDPVRESASAATVEAVAQGRGLTVRYTWAFEGAPHDGLLLIMPAPSEDAASRELTAVLVDSWHVGDGDMVCEGSATVDGLSVSGSYHAPPGPDWGWRITIELLPEAAWRLRMYNATSSGDESLAVEALYERRPA